MPTSKMYDYILFATSLGFSSKAILDDLKTHGFPEMALEHITQIAANYSPTNNTSYTAAPVNRRFIIEVYKNGTTSHEDILATAQARGFINVKDTALVALTLSQDSITDTVLTVGPNCDLANKSYEIWEKSVLLKFLLGYSTDEIHTYSTAAGNQYLLREIEAIVITTMGRAGWKNRDWNTDSKAQSYALHAFDLGLSIKEIMEQLHIHDLHLSYLTETILADFFIEMECMETKKPKVQILMNPRDYLAYLAKDSPEKL